MIKTVPNRIFLSLLILLVCGGLTFSQNYGNEWIDFSKPYYKLEVIEDGIHKVTFSDLQAAGVPVTSIDPRSLQLWRRGQQVDIAFTGQSDGVFNGSDYFEFYGLRNDGVGDQDLYFDVSQQPHSYYNLYTDTSAYFITWGGTSGNRVGTSSVTSTAAPAPYHMAEVLNVFAENYAIGDEPVSFIFLTEMSSAEGYFGNLISVNKPQTRFIEGVKNLEPSGGAMSLEANVVGRNRNVHSGLFKIGSFIQESHNYTEFEGYDYVTDTFLIPQSLIQEEELQVIIETYGTLERTDFISLGYLKLTYPSKFEAESKDVTYYNLLQTGTSTTKVSIANPPTDGVLYDVTDPFNIIKVSTNLVNGELVGVIENTDLTTRKLLLQAASKPLEVVDVEPVSFLRDDEVSPDYLLVTNRYFEDPVNEYVAYRESLLGGGYDVHLAYVDRLYNQYNYGDRSPLGIRRYCEYMYDQGNPKFLFLVGMSHTPDIKVGNTYFRHVGTDSLDENGVPYFEIEDFVPTMGWPGADIPFSTRLGTDTLTPALATGRLSAYTTDDVYAYLNKVKEYEAFEFDDLWYKNIIHLSGGKIAPEQSQFLKWMNEFKDVAESPHFGGKVTTFTKKTNELIEFFNVSEPVNEGVSLITYFGHSAPQFIEIDIGNVSEQINGYNNRGKYPVLFLNGCEAGNVFVQFTRAEDWVLTPEKGAIAAFAHTSFGYSNQLRNYCEDFYQLSFKDDLIYKEPLGVVQQKVIEQYFTGNPGASLVERTQAEQFLLIGDPAIRFFPVEQPDYETNNNSVFLTGFFDEVVTAQADSFQIGIVVSNFGKATEDSLTICVLRSFNNGANVETYSENFGPVFNKDTVFFTVPNLSNETFGLNSFAITLDCNDSIAELNELNNTAVLNYFLPSNGLRALFPKEFSVVGNDTVSFVAQSFDLLIESTTYRFELDTNHLFQNPINTALIQGGALGVWPEVVLPNVEDSTVFYWRVRFDDIPIGEEIVWANSSLMYIEGEQGWGQGELPQFYRNGLTNVFRDIPQNRWLFDTTSTLLKLRTAGAGVSDQPGKVNITVDAQSVILNTYWPGCFDQEGAYVLVFDRETAFPYHLDGVTAGTCGVAPRITNSYNLKTEGSQDAFLEYFNRVEEGDYVLFMLSGNAENETWKPELNLALQSLGALEVDSLKEGDPYILIGRKNIGLVLESRGDSAATELSETIRINGQHLSGRIVSPLIGPASTWRTYYQDFDIIGSGVQQVEIYGVNLDGSDTLIHVFQGQNKDSISLETQFPIDPVSHPYLRLEAEIEDTSSQSTPQLDAWLVLYEGVPEGTINLEVFGLSEYSDQEVTEGDTVTYRYAFQNISDLDFPDSMVVQFTITNNSTGNIEIDEVTYPPLKSGDTLIIEYNLSSSGWLGGNTVQIFVNPFIQAEEYYDNNVMVTRLDVAGDNVNPVLDVVFDGVHILDGDIVSPSPYVTITLRDENDFLPKTDTLGMELYLKKPCASDCNYERINFTDPEIVSWTPQSTNKPFQIEYNPKELVDGMYSLRIQGEDASGNKAGVKDYEIRFQVINESTITNFLPYPNPFSTSVRFVFTLTGSSVPDELKIQIMTISGTVVREVTQDEIGPLRIGSNMTDFAWDGKDEFGDQLANGVYLYRVITRINGDDVKQRGTDADKAFKKGFGKMYLLR